MDKIAGLAIVVFTILFIVMPMFCAYNTLDDLPIDEEDYDKDLYD